jgi:flagellar hook-length control protein FliK
LADGIDQPRQSTDLLDEAGPAEPSAAEEGSSASPRPETGDTAIRQRQGDETVGGGQADTPRRTAARPSDNGETQSRQDLEQSGKTAPKDVPPIATAVQAIAASTATSATAIPADAAAAGAGHVRTTATRATEPQSGGDGAAPEHRKGLERTGSLPTETRWEILLVEGSASHNSTTADGEPGQPSADPVPARSQPGRATFAAELTAAAANYTLPASREQGSDVSPAPSLQWSPVAVLAGRPPQSTSPASLVASILAAEPSWQSAAVASATQSQAVHAYVSPRVLQIQLNPSRLGVVTATLRLSGAQLTIELAASSAEAREHLKGEEHVIEKAIRALGYDVGQVSVIQSSVVIATHSRTDIPVSSGPARDQPSTDAGPSSGSGGQSNSRQGGDHGAERSGQAGGKLAADPGGGRGLYI